MSATPTAVRTPEVTPIPSWVPQGEWLPLFAQLVCSGQSIEQCAHRLHKPKNVLESAAQTKQFQLLVKEYAHEDESNTSDRMLRGARLDSVLRIIQIRDDPTAGAKTQLTAAVYILEKAPKHIADEIGDIVKRSPDSSFEENLNQEIARLLAGQPELLSRVRATSTHLSRESPPSRPNKPEPSQGEIGIAG